MTTEDWREAWELYDNARKLPQAQRDEFLNSSSPNPEVLQEVVLLLQEPEDDSSEPEFDLPVPLVTLAMGRYSVTGHLGKGGMSEVYAAQDQQLDRIVALKFLMPGTIGARSAERVMREAKTLSGLNHPNIVTVYEVIRTEAGLAIVMELVEGTALRALCGTPMREDQVVRLGRQIAQALAAAHSHGIVHRDIKPENILVRPDGYVKVVDFGLAEQVAVNTTSRHGPVLGTLRYMSPEQVRGEDVGAPSDIFSLGLVLYELITGEHPFAANSSLQTAYFIATQPVTPRFGHETHISLRLETLIGAMLAKNPDKRPTAVSVARELDEVPLASGIPSGVVPELAKYVNRRFWWVAAVIAVLGAFAAVWHMFEKRYTPEFGDIKIQPLTSQPGWENAPALSPDGQSIAFTWADKLDGVRNIYVKRLPESDPVKLTSYGEGLVGYLAWSPDSKQIAYKYSGHAYGKSGGSLFSIPVAGGNEQKLLDLVNGDLSSSLDWSPDGTELAFAEVLPKTQRMALYLFNLRTRAKRRLTTPPEGFWGDWNPKFSPDGSTLAFKRVTSFWVDDMYLVSRTGGALRRLTAARRGIWGHAWTRDGKSLIVSCQRTGSIFGIWRFPLILDAQPERVSLAATDAITPTTSRKTDQLGWVNQTWDLNIYRMAVSGAETPVKMIASTLRDQGAAYSSTGRIAFVSDRSGSREIWLAHSDGSGQVRVTNLKGPPIDHLVWSPDGRKLAFDTRLADHTGVFVLECDPVQANCSEPKRLTSQNSSEASPSWSLDGRYFYFASLRTGRWEIYKQPVQNGEPVQVTQEGGYASRESPDGRWLYFSRHDEEAILRLSLMPNERRGSSTPELVIGWPYRAQPGGWALTHDAVIFIDRTGRDRSGVIRAYNPIAKTVHDIVTLDQLFADRSDIGLTVSPDDKWILYSQLDRSGSNIMLADNR